MTRPEVRVQATVLLGEAVASGARLAPACRLLDISTRTYRRWCAQPDGDRRPTAARPPAAHALSAQERARILAICNSAAYASQSPATIVPTLADAGEYVASESSFYRVLRDTRHLTHRGRARCTRAYSPASSHRAERPCQIWTWDVTWLKAPVRGQFFYLYLIVDIFSRKIVGWEVWEKECAAYARLLVDRAVLAEGCRGTLEVLHADNGAIQKASTLRARLMDLGVTASFNRPGVRNDNAYSESLFRTCKYRPHFPEDGFADVQAVRVLVHNFAEWYNTEHKHSGIQFVTPQDRHTGRDAEILAQRRAVYEEARQRRPDRCSRNTRSWPHEHAVLLNVRKTETNR